RAINVETNSFLPAIPPARAELELNGPLWHRQKTAIEWGITGTYTAKKNHIPVASDYVLAPDAYFLLGLDIMASIPWQQQMLQLNIGASNLLNMKYRDYMDRNRYFADEMGRNVYLKLSIPFQLKHSHLPLKNETHEIQTK
ncbi:MAG TPA: TonB-dependent receptor, partial [Chitinophagaceae bacterium]|nr:TonB-dependent receptor [Chitinophagaceae bacterium]